MFVQERHTSRKRLPLEPGSLQHALREIGALNAILRATNVASIATDEDGLIQFFSVGAEQLLGYSGLEVLGTLSLSDIADPKEVRARARSLSLGSTVDSFEAVLCKASRGIQDRSELAFVHKEGHRVVATVSVTVMLDERRVSLGYTIIGTAPELEPRVEARPDALITIDTNGLISDLNKQMEALIGCSRAELLGVPFKNWFTEPERAEAGINSALKDKTVAECELIACTRDGQQRAIWLRATPFHDRRRQLGVCVSLKPAQGACEGP